jgi:RimJ/RimL family protein N-acetyltransferase
MEPVLVDVPDRVETERLILRSQMPGDGPAVNAAILDSWTSLHEWMPWAQLPPTVAETEGKMRQGRASFIARTDLPMLIVRREGGTVIGGTGLHRMDWSVPRFEIGYWLGASYWGHGYVTEAVRALTALALDTLAAVRVEIHCSHRNLRSQQVALRCGYTLEARLRNHGREPSGELRDMMVYARVRDDAA